MFIQSGLYSGLVSAIKFNRLLSLLISLNLLVYSSKPGWICLLVYVIVSEIFIKITKNNALRTKKVCNTLFQANMVITTLFLSVIAYISGNMDYVFLCIVPVFQAAFYRKPLYIAGIIGAAGAFVLAGSFAVSQFISFMTVMGVLTFLGLALSQTLSNSNSKADYLHNIATTDALTGLLNRREFDRRISEEFSRAKRHRGEVSLALFDIDFFKKINDSYGHNTGDTILKEIGGILASNTRNCDIVARYGGEEFALILPETPQTKAYELMDRLRELIENDTFNKTEKPIKCTISIGVAQLDLTDASPRDFVERTDKALYRAKENGRNRVERAPFGVHFVARQAV